MARKQSKNAGPSSRPARIAEQIRQELSSILESGAISDPRIGLAMVTVTAAEITPDLQHAKVFISVFGGPDGAPQVVMKGLISAAKHLRGEIGHRLGLRYAPELRFVYDESVERGAKIEALIKEVATDGDVPETTDAPQEQDD